MQYFPMTQLIILVIKMMIINRHITVVAPAFIKLNVKYYN